MVENVEFRERDSNVRFPFVEIVGAPGSGKSRLTQTLRLLTGMYGRDEKFEENPSLKSFYFESKKENSFACQTFFMEADAKAAAEDEKLLGKQMVFSDAGKVVNSVVATIQRTLGYMTCDEYKDYLRKRQEKYSGLLRADVLVYLRACEDRILKGIRERARDMEVYTLENDPGYFPALVKGFDLWLLGAKKTRRIIEIDVDKHSHPNGNGINYLVIAREVLNWVDYYVSSPHQLNSIGADGKTVIFPQYLR